MTPPQLNDNDGYPFAWLAPSPSQGDLSAPTPANTRTRAQQLGTGEEGAFLALMLSQDSLSGAVLLSNRTLLHAKTPDASGEERQGPGGIGSSAVGLAGVRHLHNGGIIR